MNDANLLLEILHTDCGASDNEIALACGVSRHHINQIRHEHKQASQALTGRLENLARQMLNSDLQPPRKPYTWQAGHDIRQATKKNRQVRSSRSWPARAQSRAAGAPAPRVYPPPQETIQRIGTYVEDLY